MFSLMDNLKLFFPVMAFMLFDNAPGAAAPVTAESAAGAEPAAEGEIKPGDEGMVEALNKEIKKNDGKAAQEGAGKPGEKAKTAEEIEAERVAAEEKAKKDAEDPELELPGGIKVKRSVLEALDIDLDGKTKVKLADLKKGYMLQSDYTKKTQEIAAEKANLKEVVDIIDYLKKNPAKAERIVKILEEKEAEAEAKELDLTKEIEGIDKLLKDLPADDPYAQALRSQKAIIQQTLKVNQQLQERLNQLEGGRKTEQESKLLEEAHQTLTKVMSAKEKALNFADPEEAAYWKKQTLIALHNSRKEYAEMDEAQFTDYFNKLADQVHAEMVKLGEKSVSRYIKTKGAPGGVPVVGGAALPAKTGEQPITAENLQESLEAGLKAEAGKETT
jgi:hypothetical protein